MRNGSDEGEEHAMDTSERTKQLDQMKASHREEVAAVRADGDLTQDAQNRRLTELERGFNEAFDEETLRVMAGIDAEIEAAYRKAHGAPEKRGVGSYTDHQEETARELRLARIREEVRDDLEGGLDPLLAYQEAVRLGDKERADVLGRMGPRYLKETTRKQRLRELVEEQLPESRRRAKKDLERLEAEKRSLDLGFAMQRAARGRHSEPLARP